MADNGYVTAEQAQAAKAKPLRSTSARSARRSMRRTISPRTCGARWSTQFGEDGLYGRADRASAGDGRVNGGLSVRTTLDPNLQRMARKALIDGLVAFDREQGLARRRAAHRDRRRLGRSAERHRDSRRPGALASRRRAGIAAHQGGGRLAAGAAGRTARFVAEREAVEIPFDEMKWAKTGKRRTQGRHRCAERRRRHLGRAQEPGPG